MDRREAGFAGAAGAAGGGACTAWAAGVVGGAITAAAGGGGVTMAGCAARGAGSGGGGGGGEGVVSPWRPAQPGKQVRLLAAVSLRRLAPRDCLVPREAVVAPCGPAPDLLMMDLLAV